MTLIMLAMKLSDQSKRIASKLIERFNTEGNLLESDWALLEKVRDENAPDQPLPCVVDHAWFEIALAEEIEKL